MQSNELALPRLCENSDVVLESRISVSISENRRPAAFTTSVGRPQQRKQFSIDFTQARFHIPWDSNRHQETVGPSTSTLPTSCILCPEHRCAAPRRASSHRWRPVRSGRRRIAPPYALTAPLSLRVRPPHVSHL